MSDQLTSRERRGLLTLLILLVGATLALTLRDCTRPTPGSDTTAPAATDTPPTIITDTTTVTTPSSHKRRTRKPPHTSAPQPSPRSPLDETLPPL